MSPLHLRIDGRIFKDQHNRQVTLYGINVAGDAKFPATPDLPSHVPDRFFDGDDVSFVGRPFSVHDADTHFARLRRWGYNTIRYIFTWEAIEPAGPGRYDEEWIQHTIAVLRVAKKYGFYVWMDPHQDVWSRFSGGSGAPMWTLYACGLNPRAFAATEAALVQNTYPDPAAFPKMIWATNYTRLACQVMFTLFFAGRTFAPLCVLDGKNIQDYLQEHFINAVQHLARRVKEAGDLHDETVIGWESMNEPNRGLVGHPDLSTTPQDHRLQKGTSPTPWQAMLLGSGRACEVETWDVGGMGPYKSGSTLVDPHGTSAWLQPSDGYDDTNYGWKRDPGWHLGECVWAQHGVWDPASDELLQKEYFATMPESGEELTYEVFTNRFFVAHYTSYRNAIREVFPDAIMFCQPPVLELPPSLRGTENDDPNMVYAPHYYDGITLMTKKWNRLWNVDVFGVLRGRYLFPALAIKIGETAIRNCFRDQLAAMQAEGVEYLGEHPCILGEIGIPFDMDDSHAYRDGDFSSQLAALDANHFALEGSNVAGHALWCYTATNTHRRGDNWNGEDLSVVSLDDRALPPPASADVTPATLRESLAPTDPMTASTSARSSTSAADPADPSATSSTARLRTAPQQSSSSLTDADADANKPAESFRAAAAHVRPHPVAVHGRLRSCVFDLRGATFRLELEAPSAPKQDAPTEIVLPPLHFPAAPSGATAVEVSGGKWSISTDEGGSGAGVQVLRWWHGEGEQKLVVRGVKVAQELGGTGEEDVGYVEWLQKSCSVM